MSDELDTIGEAELPLGLPEYHGRAPKGQRTSLTGAGSRIVKEHEIGDRVVLVVEAKVKSAGHTDTDDGLIYLEALKVVDLFEVAPKAASRLLAGMRQQARADADAGTREPLPDMGEIGYTDAAGVVLTPKELAEMRGDPAAAITGDTEQPAVIVLASGARLLWPDELDQAMLRPIVGQTVNGEQVTDVLDAITGESLEWIDVSASVVTAEISSDDAPAEIPEAQLPTKADFEFVDRPIDVLRDELEDITDGDEISRIYNAEQQGRGRALKPRKGALEFIAARRDRIADSVILTPPA